MLWTSEKELKMKDYIRKAFIFIFGEEPNEEALDVILEDRGEKAVRKALKYLTINKANGTLRPPTGKSNPYGLIDRIIETDKRKDKE